MEYILQKTQIINVLYSVSDEINHSICVNVFKLKIFTRYWEMQFLAGIPRQREPITAVSFRPDHNHWGQFPHSFRTVMWVL